MKKTIAILLAFAFCFLCVTACKSSAKPRGKSTNGGGSSPAAAEPFPVFGTPVPEKRSLTLAEFDELLVSLPLTVEETHYVVQDETYKSLYPDLLQVILLNRTDADIRSAVVAFAAWDENDLPVKIKGDLDYSGGDYVKKVRYSDINMIPGSLYGKNGGYEIDESCGIARFRAVVVSFETFEGDTWENPYFDEWQTLFDCKKFSDAMTVEVTVEDAAFHGSGRDLSVDAAAERELAALIDAQAFRVVETNYIVQDEQYKSLYPDLLQAVVYNGTELDIKDAVVAFAAWDENGLPVRIKGSMSFSDPSYVRKVNYSGINMIPGASYGKNGGYELDSSCKIASFKAIVVSYTAFDGTEWDNPLFEQWCAMYEGVKLRISDRP